MLIYRVETAEGLGPWCDENGSWDRGAGTAWCHNAHSLHHVASKWMDETKRSTKWRFGFIHLDQMMHYMHHIDPVNVSAFDRTMLHQSLDTMKRLGLGVSVYSCYHGNAIGDLSQCIFDRDSARLIRHLDPNSTFLREYVDNYGREAQAILDNPAPYTSGGNNEA